MILQKKAIDDNAAPDTLNTVYWDLHETMTPFSTNKLTNVALNKKTEAHNDPDGHSERINDGNTSTKWDGGRLSATGKPYEDPITPGWTIIDLDGLYDISQISLFFENSDIWYQYELYTSLDKEQWVKVGEKKNEEKPSESEDTYLLENTKARYVKLKTTNIKVGSDGKRMPYGVMELQVFGRKISIDKDALNAAVKEAEKLEKEDYTVSTWEVFSIALQDAKGVLIKEDATQEDVDKAVEALNNAKEALERRASEQLLEALSEKVNAAETLKDDYTTEEFKDVQAAIDVARALLANPEEAGSMDAVNALITLVQAISDLPEDPSFDKLREDLEETLKYVKENILNDTEGLRPGKVQELKDAVAEAEELLQIRR